MAPFCFVLLISVIRELVEDLKKANYDKLYNNSEATQYNENTYCFEKVCWKDISVGKIIKINKNDMIPADILVLKSSSSNGFCYLQTSSLDGETGLKPREAIVRFQSFIKNEADLIKIKGDILVDEPNENIYSINGSITMETNEKIYFSVTNTLLRGGILKNVDYVYGLVIYTGKETKIMKNIKHSAIKQSTIERKLNSIIIYVIIITFIVCIVCTILGFIFWNNNRPIPDDIRSEYVFYTLVENQGVNEGFKIFGSFFTIFNTLIPISVMITLEVVKGMQVFMMNADEKLREKFGEKSKFLSMKLHEDLGNIKYIFTDKTGTLTKNEMEFKACSIFTQLFEEKQNPQNNEDGIENQKTNGHNINNNNDNLRDNEPLGLVPGQKNSIFASSFNPQILINCLKSDEPIDIKDNGKTPFLSVRETAIEFFLNIALNHNVLTETDNETGEVYYSGSSPDEVVLVQSAKEIGMEFLERSGDLSKVRIIDKEFTFQVLQRFEYSSERKRSSIIVKDEFGNIKLYMKGADKVILDKIDDYTRQFVYGNTKHHLDHFCKGGLRTLVYSMKMLPEELYREWESEFNKVQEIVLRDKTRKGELESMIEAIEKKMTLMGATALEDKLQDDVKGVLNDFIEADINVWMLTGDQLDTAESIGYSCRLFNDDTEIFKLRDGYKNETVKEILKKFLEEMEKTEENILNYKIEKKRKFRSNLSHQSAGKNKNNVVLNAQALMRKEMENMKNNNFGNIINNNNVNNNVLFTNNNNNFYNENNTELLNLKPKPLSGGKNINRNYNNDLLFNMPISPIVNSEMKLYSGKTILNSTKDKIIKLKTFAPDALDDLGEKEAKIYGSEVKGGEADEIYKNIKVQKAQQNLPYASRYENYKEDFNKMRQNLENGNQSVFTAHQENNLKRMRTNYGNSNNIYNLNNDSSNNYNYNNISNASYAYNRGLGFNSNGPILTKKISNVPIDIHQLNAEGIKFIGGNLDKKSNKITLNFVKNTQNSLQHSNRPMTPGYSKSNRPVSSSIYSSKRNYLNNMMNPVFKNNLNNINNNMVRKESNNIFGGSNTNVNILGNSNNNNNYNLAGVNNANNNYNNGNYNNNNNNFQSFDDSQNYEPGDFSIIKYMVDVDVFENNKNQLDYTFIKNLVGDNIQASKMNEDGVIEFKPVEDPLFTPGAPNNNVVFAPGENANNNNNNDKNFVIPNKQNFKNNKNFFNELNEKNFNPNNINNDPNYNNDLNEESANLNLDKLLEDYKMKVMNIERARSTNPFDFVIREEKKDFSMTNFGLIIEGNAIAQCLNAEIYPIFWELVLRSRAIICCRCSPNFKSDVVEFVKKMSNQTTLAIGDGGNDVNMIKAANIGVGIFGKEGHQAAFNSDYAISQFKYLERLLFYHGRYSVLRNSHFINFFFFKNLIFTFPQFWFSLFSGFSGALLWDDWYYLGYNSFISTLPAASRMLFEEDIDVTFKDIKDKKIKLLMEGFIPDIYKETRDSKPFNIPKFFFVFLCGFLHSLIIYFFPFLSYRFNMCDSSGKGITLWDHSISGYYIVLAIQYVIVFEDTFLVNIYTILINLLQFGITIFFFIIYNSFDGMQVGGILNDIIGNFQIWLIIILTTVTCVLPYMIYRRWEVLFYDDIINNLRHDKYQQDYNKKTYMKKIEAVTKYTRSIAKFRKIFNNQDDFEPENLADKKIKAVVDGFRSSKRKTRHPVLADQPDNLDGTPNLEAQLNPLAINNNNINFNEAEGPRGYRKYSNFDEHDRAISLENNYYPVSRKVLTHTSQGSFNHFNNNNNIYHDNNEIPNFKNYSEKNNMNINNINTNNNLNNYTNNQGSSDPNTHSVGPNGSHLIRNSGPASALNQIPIHNTSNQPLKNNSNSNINYQNSNSNNYNYNYIHPYDEEDLINEHLGGKFKPITTTITRRVLNPNESYERDYKIVSRENNKFEFNFNKFKNNNNQNNNNTNVNVNNNNFNNNNFNGSLGANNNFAPNVNANLIINSNGNGMNRVTNMIGNDNDNIEKENENLNINNNIAYNLNGNDDRILIEKNNNTNFNNFENLDEDENLNLRNTGKADDLIVSDNLKQTSKFYNPNDSKRKLIENEKLESRSISRKSDSKNNSQLKNQEDLVEQHYELPVRDNVLIDENQNMAFDENMEELKNTNALKQSKNSENINNINEFTFKRSTIAENSKLKSSIVGNIIEMEEMDHTNNPEHTAILGLNSINKRDPVVNDYPLEITHSQESDYVRLNNNNNNDHEDYPDIQQS